MEYPIPEAHGQKTLCQLVHSKISKELFESFDNLPREQNRLRTLSLAHATAFIHAPPNCETGTLMSPQEFRFALRWMLGLAIVPEGFQCPTCSEGSGRSNMFDTFGDHALVTPQLYPGRVGVFLHFRVWLSKCDKGGGWGVLRRATPPRGYSSRQLAASKSHTFGCGHNFLHPTVAATAGSTHHRSCSQPCLRK